MNRNRIIRIAAAVLLSAAGIHAATSAGAPFLSALLALFAGSIAISLLWAPGKTEEAGPLASSDQNGRNGLPKVTDLVDAFGYPILVVRDRKIILANEAAQALLGSHIAGVDVRLAIRHPAAAEKLIGDCAEPSRTELTGLGGPDRRWEMTVAPLTDDSRLVRLLDRSEAHAAEQMRVDFVANASHELRTPLAALIGYAETLEDEDAAADPALRRRFLKIIGNEARRMQQLVDDLISLSRIEAERFSVPSDPVALLPLLEEIRGACSYLVAERNSRIIVDAKIPSPLVPGDKDQLFQMLQNLVVNALKYGRPGNDVIVRIEEAQHQMLRISVIDEGEGIAAEHIPRLTERFYRVDPGRSRSMGGTGLGLAIVKHIVSRHRGRLDIQSRVGKGTVVAVDLPSLSSKSHESVTEG